MGHFVGAVPRVSSRGRHRLSSELSAYSQDKFEVKGQILRGVWHSPSLLSERCFEGFISCVRADRRLSVCLQK